MVIDDITSWSTNLTKDPHFSQRLFSMLPVTRTQLVAGIKFQGLQRCYQGVISFYWTGHQVL